MTSFRPLFRCISVVLLSPLAVPQTTLRVDVNLVNVFVSVQDGAGNFVDRLQREDFQIFEDDVPQKIEIFEKQDDIQSSIGILVDNSGSSVDILPLTTRGVRDFARGLGKDDEYFVLSFGTEVALIHDFHQRARHLEAALVALKPWGTSVLYDALYLGMEKVREGSRERKVLVVLTDGNDNGSKTSRRTVIDEAQRGAVQFYFIALGSPLVNDMRTLEDLASTSGGKSILASKTQRVSLLLENIQADLRHQYYIGYYAPRSPGYHRIRVETPGKTFNLRAKTGYTG